jgi:hypothetical protein
MNPRFRVLGAVAVAALSTAAHAQTGACCLSNASCVNTDQAGCTLLGGEFLGAGTSCATVNCLGACCLPSGDCALTSLDGCAGAFRGAGTSCGTHCPGPLSTGFSYQGRLAFQGAPVDGPVAMTFKLFDSAVGGQQIGSTLANEAVPVVDGLFTIDLDFGAVFNENRRWLEITVSGAVLSPRQPAMPAPVAHMALRPWQTAGTATFFTGGNVGIGTAAPAARLHVAEGTSGTGLILPGLRVFQNASSPNVVGGFSGNTITTGVVGATIAGGGESAFHNRVTDDFGTVAGGWTNQAGDGVSTPFSAVAATVGGGAANSATAASATVGGGGGNLASGVQATVGGGNANQASGSASSIAGGAGNQTSGSYSSVGGGDFQCLASGQYSFAAGRRAKATHHGSFVLADNTDADFGSAVAGRFRARFVNGYQLITNSAGTTGVQVLGNATAWSSICDRNVKHNYAPIDPVEIANRLAAMPLARWTYIDDEHRVPHMGPTAQDFYEAFGLGDSDLHISTLDADGVLFAAVQGLHQLVQEKDAAIEQLRAEKDAEIEALHAMLAAFERRLAQLEGRN